MTDGTAQSGARILLVEDDKACRALVRAMVSRCTEPELRGACLVEASDLAQARAALAGTTADAPVDVVLLDLNLPDGCGLDLAVELRDWRAGPLPAVVAVTGDSGPGQASEAIAAGCQAVLPKPYTAAALCDLVATLLRAAKTAPDAG
jgi:CheY-like chemotaxis protein